MHLFTHKEGQVTPVTVTPVTIFMKRLKWLKWLLQGIKPHFVNHGILTKLSSLIHFN